MSDNDDNNARAIQLWREQNPEKWAELERRLSPEARKARRAARAAEAQRRLAEALDRWDRLSPEEQQLKREQWLYDNLGGWHVPGAPGARFPRPGELVTPGAPVPPASPEKISTDRARVLYEAKAAELLAKRMYSCSGMAKTLFGKDSPPELVGRYKASNTIRKLIAPLWPGWLDRYRRKKPT